MCFFLTALYLPSILEFVCTLENETVSIYIHGNVGKLHFVLNFFTQLHVCKAYSF